MMSGGDAALEAGHPNRPSGAFISVRSLTRRFGGLVAIDELDLDIARGSLHALIGPNGAGKTTAINLLSGELKPSSGTIRSTALSLQGGRPM